MQVTLKDIAQKTGFSITTVSRALSGYSDVNAKTRARILDAAKQMGYRPNLVARQLRNQQTQTISMIVPSGPDGFEDDFFSVLMKGVTHAAARHHYDVLISALLPGDNEMDVYRRVVGGQRVDGVILARTYRNDPRIAYLREINVPFVVSGRASPDQPSDFPYIDADSQAGLALLVAHLVDYGHEHIGLILPPKQVAFTGYRLRGYQHGLAAANLPYRDDYIATADLTRDGGEQATAQLLAEQPRLTAIIACNDLMAIGAMNAVQARGLTVGVDVAISGFDDIPLAAHTTPTLTTIQQPIFTIGEELTTMLVSIMTEQGGTPAGKLIKPTLVIRESSGIKK